MGKSVALRLRGQEHITGRVAQADPTSDFHHTADSFSRILAGASVPQALSHASRPTIFGTTYNDIIVGTAGADYIADAWGDDAIDGAGGDDVIVVYGGNNILRGGQGSDYIHFAYLARGTFNYDNVETSLIEAGDGADFVQIDVVTLQHLTIDLGTGNDQVRFNPALLYNSDIRVTTGTGADRLVLDYGYGRVAYGDNSPIVVTDFTAGAGGDILDLGGFVAGLFYLGTMPANPFAGGSLSLIQVGADVVVRVDREGSIAVPFDLVRLQNVSLAALTSYNLAGYQLNGSAPARDSASGTAGTDWLTASVGGSDLFGLDGGDRLTGGIGNDLLEGGRDGDILYGGRGNDILRGGDGNDVLNDDDGNDTLEGGAGDDIIAINRPALELFAPGLHETVIINAGDGQDYVSFQRQPRESSSQALRAFTLRVDLGGGDDRLVIPVFFDDMRFTLGAGVDRVVLDRRWDEFTGPVVITDFAAGHGGDVLELDKLLRISPGWDGVGNPFTGGWLVLQQDGADTLVIHDYDGSAGGAQGPANVYQIARLLNVNAASLTAFNFNGYAPGGAASTFLVGSSTSGNDTLYGTYGNDIIDAGQGDDWIEERKGGNDSLSGGDGNDTIIVRQVNQQATGTIIVNGGAGNDLVEYSGSFGSLVADLGPGDDRLVMYASAELGATLTLGSGVDVVVIDQAFGAQAADGLITITDFATGAGGDRLDWALYGQYESFNTDPDNRAQYGPVLNPFLTDSFRLVQSGADVLLQVGGFLNGAPFPLPYETIIRFSNTTAAAFTAWNLGFDPWLATQNGGTGNDTLTGTGNRDVLFGNDGNDQLDGLDGADLLRGHDGNDILNGGSGDDYLVGGDGDDNLSGGDDADFLDGGRGTNIVDGGAGDDLIYARSSSDVIAGGDGADGITVSIPINYTGALGSLDAGSGNDIVHVLNRNAPTAYSITLGAGDDTIYLMNLVGSLLLGSGRDTIVYTNNSRASGGLVFADFVPGNTGDIFDLEAFMNEQLPFSRGTIYLERAGLDPFALGLVELRQAGNDVELWVFPDGSVDTDLYSQTPLRFLNTTVAQFTAANFGGYDPHATPNRVTVVHDDLTIVAGQTLTRVDVTPVQVFLSDSFSAQFLFRNWVEADFVNHGTITTVLNEDVFFHLAGVVIDRGNSAGGSFVNAADGNFIVESTVGAGLGNVSHPQTYGFYAAQQSVSFRNDGYFEVTAAAGTAYAFFGGYDFEGQPVVNNGTVFVTGGYDAIGFWMGQTSTFLNTGTIDVWADQVAVGVYLDQYQDGHFTNQGLIIVATAADSPFASIGVLGLHGIATEVTYTNTGTIIADIAFLSDDHDSPTSDNRNIFLNLGTIFGSMVMGDGMDRIINDGTMIGYADLGALNDVFDGGAGIYRGIIDGGTGDDILIAGRGAQTLIGGEGNDRLVGGRGNDRLEGGAGADTFRFEAPGDSRPGAIRSDGKKYLPDVIADFTPGTDKIDLSAIDAISGTAPNDAFTFIGAGAFTHQAGQIRAVTANGSTSIYADLDGDGFANMHIVLLTPVTLTAADFIL